MSALAFTLQPPSCALQSKTTINAIVWTPGGRRVFAAAHSGEFALWAGAAGFAFESVLQASCWQLMVVCEPQSFRIGVARYLPYRVCS